VSKQNATPRYAANIVAATKAAQEIGGRTWWPSPVDHVHARDRITKALKADGKPVTKANVMALVGVPQTKLRAIANMKAGREELAKLKPVNALMNDSSAKGRNLAAIVIVWCAELDAAARTSKASK
jgi:hypothetical protein